MTWRNQLPQLEGWPLLPCGAGEKGKAPIDPATGHCLSDWQTMAFTPEQIIGMNGVVSCVGSRFGPDADFRLALDIDGAYAKQFCLDHGCSFDDGVGWAITRSTSKDRLKVVIWLPEELRHFLLDDDGLPLGKVVLTTKPPVYEEQAEGTKILIEPAEQIELFYGAGQCIVLGEHKESGGEYQWQGSPQEVAEPLPEWWAVITKVLEARRVHQAPTRVPINSGGTTSQSGPRSPCPICGRDHSAACTTYSDGGRRRVNCFHGQSFFPPLGLKAGETITIDGCRWAFADQFINPAIGLFSTFVEHQERGPRLLDREALPAASMNDAAMRLAVSEQLATDRRIFSIDSLLPADLAEAVKVLNGPLPTDDLGAVLIPLAGLSGLLKLGTKVAASMDYEVPMNLFLAVGAPTGTAKSSVLRTYVQTPADHLCEDMAKAHQQAWQQWDEGNRGKKRTDRPPAPRELFPHVHDYTPEALTVQLVEHEKKGLGLLVVRDEMSGLFAALKADSNSGGGRGESQLLELFDGQAHTQLRVESGPRSYRSSHVSVVGFIQPDVWREVVNGNDPTGKFARFLYFSMPVRPLVLNDEPPSQEEQEAFRQAENTLKSYASSFFKEPPRTYVLSSEARRRFNHWFYGHQVRAQMPGVSKMVAAILGKTAAHALRLAGVLHLVYRLSPSPDSPGGSEISAETMDVAMAMVDQLTAETESFHEMPETSDSLLMRHIHALSWNQGRPKEVDLASVRGSSGRELRASLNAAAFSACASALEDSAFGQVKQQKATNGKQKCSYMATKAMAA